MAKPVRTHDPVRLTKRTVDAAKTEARGYFLWETDIKGFGLKVTLAGRKSYLLKYRTKAGIARKPTIGVHGTITADLARDKGKPFVPGQPLKNELRRISSVDDFTFHPCRDTVSTWLQNEGHSEYERALVLNHAGGGTVTGDYSHGYTIQLKRQLLEEWAAHVAKVVQPEGAVLLS